MLFNDLSSERVVNAFSKKGFRIIKQGKHIGMSDGTHRITIPRHKRINPYTLKSIIKDAGLTEESVLLQIEMHYSSFESTSKGLYCT